MALARAFLSIQAISASPEWLFGDAGHQHGIGGQQTQDTVTEMLLTIRSFVKYEMDGSKQQQGFISS